jgi:hypothetical protein
MFKILVVIKIKIVMKVMRKVTVIMNQKIVMCLGRGLDLLRGVVASVLGLGQAPVRDLDVIIASVCELGIATLILDQSPVQDPDVIIASGRDLGITALVLGQALIREAPIRVPVEINASIRDLGIADIAPQSVRRHRKKIQAEVT